MTRYFTLIVSMAFAIACSSSSNTKTDANNANDPGLHSDAAVDIPSENGGDVPVVVDHGIDHGQPAVDTNQPDNGNPVDTAVDTNTGGGCPSVAVSGSTCAEVGACMLACDDATYQAQCKSGSTSSATADFQAVEDCAKQANCDPIFTGEKFTQCVLDNCETQYDKCFVGTKTCQSIRDCRKDCPAGDPTCPVKCVAQGSTKAQEDYFKYVTCLFDTDCVKVLHQVMANGWPTDDCEKNARGINCGNYWQACMNPH